MNSLFNESSLSTKSYAASSIACSEVVFSRADESVKVNASLLGLSSISLSTKESVTSLISLVLPSSLYGKSNLDLNLYFVDNLVASITPNRMNIANATFIFYKYYKI